MPITPISKIKVDTTEHELHAYQLTTARTIALSGDVSGSTTFDGSKNATITTAVTNNFLRRPNDLPTETSLVTVSSTGTHTYKKVSELVDTTSMQTITGAKVFADIPAVFRDTLGNNTETQFLSGSIMHKKGEAQYIFYYPSASGTVALTPSSALTEPSVVVNAVDRTPTWKPLSEIEVSVPTRSQIDLLF